MMAINTILFCAEAEEILIKMDRKQFDDLYQIMNDVLWKRLFPPEVMKVDFDELDRELKKITWK